MTGFNKLGYEIVKRLLKASRWRARNHVEITLRACSVSGNVNTCKRHEWTDGIEVWTSIQMSELPRCLMFEQEYENFFLDFYSMSGLILTPFDPLTYTTESRLFWYPAQPQAPGTKTQDINACKKWHSLVLMLTVQSYPESNTSTTSLSQLLATYSSSSSPTCLRAFRRRYSRCYCDIDA